MYTLFLRCFSATSHGSIVIAFITTIIFLSLLTLGIPCFHGDSLYKPWERFVNQACTGYCTCNGRSGNVGCVSLCPPSPIPMCAQGEVPEIRNEPAAADKTGRCRCKRKSCNPRPKIPPLPLPGGPPEQHGKFSKVILARRACNFDRIQLRAHV